MNILTQASVKDSHKLIGLSFLDISELDHGLKVLADDIESGLVSEVRAMEVAMHSVSYSMSKYQEAQAVMDDFIDNPEQCNSNRNQAYELIREARDQMLAVEGNFTNYPAIVKTAKSIRSMLAYYEGCVLIPTFFEVMKEKIDKKSVCTYFFRNPLTKLIKIGRSNNVKTRKQAVQCGSGAELEVLLVINKDIENQLHKKFAKYQKHNEWFEDTDGFINDYISQQMQLKLEV